MVSFRKEFKKLWQKHVVDLPTASYIRHNRKKWLPLREKSTHKVVLLSLYDWKPSVFCFSKVANYLARKHQSGIQTFSFAEKKNPTLDKVYASFGAEPGLTYGNLQKYEDESERLAQSIFENLTSKKDILQISQDGVRFGDLIYNTYLRSQLKPTVDIQDPQLKKIIKKGLMVFFASQQYLKNHEVVALFPDHIVYLEPGILTRLAFYSGIPVYLSSYKFYYILIRLDPTLITSMPNNFKLWPYYKYKEIYEGLPQPQKEEGLQRAREALKARLSGEIHSTILKGFSAYMPETDERVLSETDNPKILVLLHDFCDSVHCFRHMLFADFYEWIYFLLERAEKTDFEWYVKPHPNSFINQRKNQSNHSVIEELKAKFPKIRFLDAKVSNRQLIKEGIQAMFTMHSTAGHEFPYMGVPVVNAGDNLHISFNFNLHPKSLEEYENYIHSANKLNLSLDREEVEAFIYMHYFYFFDKYILGDRRIDLSFLQDQAFLDRVQRSEAYRDLISHDSAELDAEFHAYFDQYFDLIKYGEQELLQPTH